MAYHYGLDQIRVNCVAPGMVYTPMVRGGSGMSDEVRQLRIEQNLLKTEGTAWDVGHGKSNILFPWVVYHLWKVIRKEGKKKLASLTTDSDTLSLQQGGKVDYRADHARRWRCKKHHFQYCQYCSYLTTTS